LFGQTRTSSEWKKSREKIGPGRDFENKKLKITAGVIEFKEEAAVFKKHTKTYKPF
tara:strand:- start:792 stop:959 length:168 start_codon:yes stop_codon:yes gene_type:complete